MTTSSGEFKRHLSGVSAKVTHAAIWLGVTNLFMHAWWYGLHPTQILPFTWWSQIPQVLVFTSIVGAFYHERNVMCLPCMSAVPADGPVRATVPGWPRRLLWYFHLAVSWKFIIPLMLGVDAVVAFTDFYIVQIVWPLETVFFLASWREHRLLRPWCPWCRGWDGDGDEELTPAPDPSMEKTS